MTLDTFKDTVASGVHFVKIGATWCQPCKMLDRLIPEITEKLLGKAEVIKIDVDESPEVAGTYNVVSVPTVIVIKDGIETSRVTGMKSVADFVALV